MISRRHIGFFTSLIFTLVILALIPYDEEFLSLKWLERNLFSDTELTKFINQNCSEWEELDSSNLEKRVKNTLNIHLSKKLQKEMCRVTITHSKKGRFFLKNFFAYSLKINSIDFSTNLERTYEFAIPTPITLFSHIAFLLAIAFDCRFWSIGVCFFSFCILISALNFLDFLSFSTTVVSKTVSEQSTIGIFLMIIWLCLFRSRKTKNRKTIWTNISKLCIAFFGLWNPVGYTLLGKFFLPFKKRIDKISQFLSYQVLFCAISLYFLSIDSKINFDNFFLPRYFTFTIFLLVILSGFSFKSEKSEPWTFHLLISIFVGALFELISRYFGFLHELGSLGRIFLVFIIVEFIFYNKLSLKVAFKRIVPLVVTLFIGSFVGLLASMSGITDLILSIVSPQSHPVAISLTTFICGILLGFFTGSFSISFFTFYPLIFVFSDLGAIKAALIDGVLAGSLLSPFSCLNLFITIQNKIHSHELIKQRLKYLSIPLLIGIIVHSISAINIATILQPITFIFACLIIIAFYLKKRGWQF